MIVELKIFLLSSLACRLDYVFSFVKKTEHMAYLGLLNLTKQLYLHKC